MVEFVQVTGDLFADDAALDYGCVAPDVSGDRFPVTLWRRRTGAPELPVALTPEVEALLAKDAAVAIGVSGGKDSQACAIAVIRHLDAIGYRGPRVLVHSDLGRVEWKDSLPCCERLAEKLGVELLVVRRAAGDMLARWEGRWVANMARYRDLSCVRTILPWSTPAMRFCTSELKVAVIASALKKRFKDQDIINVTGVRREESSARSKMPVSAPQTSLIRKGKTGLAWNAIIEWPVEQVVSVIEDFGLDLHEAYTKYGTGRVSCAYCVMSSMSDLLASAGCADNQPLYVRMVELEAESSFAFQSSRWLGDVAPELLTPELRERVAHAKVAAKERAAIEAEIPAHLLFTAGYPTALPNAEEAEVIASVRRRIAALLNIAVDHVTASAVQARYDELLTEKLGGVAA